MVFQNYITAIKLFNLLSHLGEGRGPSFEETSSDITQGCFVPWFVQIDRKAHLDFQLRLADDQFPL